MVADSFTSMESRGTTTESTEGEVPESPGLTGDQRWVLARQTDPIRHLGLASSLSPLRAIAEDEQARIDAAGQLFDHFGASWPHTAASRLAQETIDAARSIDAGANRALGVINPADVERVEWTLTSYARVLDQWIRTAVSDAEGPLLQPAQDAAADPAVNLCTSIASAPEGSVTIVVRRGHGSPTTFLVRDVPPNADAEYDLLGVLLQSLAACRLMADAELAAAELPLLESGCLLRSLAAEAVWGRPVLIPAATDWSSSPANVTIRSVKTFEIEQVMAACAVAKTRIAALAAGTALAPTPTASSSTETSPVIDSPGAVAPDQAASPTTGDEDTTEQPVAGGETGPSDGPGPAVIHAGGFGQPIDLELVLQETTRFAAETEQHWSDALRDLMANDIGDARARATSLVTALLGHIAAREGADSAVGSLAIPLDAQAAASLKFDADAPTRMRQRATAVAYALGELASAIDALGKPTVSKFDLVTGGVESWWRQAGFTRVHEAAQFAARIVNPPEGLSASLGMFQLAQASWLAGLPEATVIYEVAALGGTSERSPELEEARRVLLAAAEGLVSGATVRDEALVLIARFWLEELERRLSSWQPPFAPQGQADEE